jgi:hypothetical protein
MAVKTVNKKFDTYLTDMKELPPESIPESKVMPTQKPPKENVKNLETKVASQTDEYEDEFMETEETNKPPFSSKDVILGIVNLISVILLIVILVRLPSKADELSSLREEVFRSEDVTLDSPGYNEAKKKADDLSKLFLTDSGIVDFVSDLEKIRSDGGVITKISFVSPKAVKDKSGNFGLAVLIELTGSWENIAATFRK